MLCQWRKQDKNRKQEKKGLHLNAVETRGDAPAPAGWDHWLVHAWERSVPQIQFFSLLINETFPRAPVTKGKFVSLSSLMAATSALSHKLPLAPLQSIILISKLMIQHRSDTDIPIYSCFRSCLHPARIFQLQTYFVSDPHKAMAAHPQLWWRAPWRATQAVTD